MSGDTPTVFSAEDERDYLAGRVRELDSIYRASEAEVARLRAEVERLTDAATCPATGNLWSAEHDAMCADAAKFEARAEQAERDREEARAWAEALADAYAAATGRAPKLPWAKGGDTPGGGQ